jgi:CCR4-NOT transcription complex subunit 4
MSELLTNASIWLKTIAVLRSSDYFGRYGKISRIQLQKRTPPGAETPIVGVYITYLRREDAERAIQAIDGSPSPSGGGEIMRASHGTAKYCTSFLRNVTCTNNNCLDAHEWGDPEDCFTREELTTLYDLLLLASV